VERTFLILGAVLGLVGVALGAFGSHALRAKLPPERVATFETGIRYQMWHALALFVVVAVGGLRIGDPGRSSAYLIAEGTTEWPAAVAGWLFVAGIVLFSGSLYALALTGRRSIGAITPLGGLCLLGGWALLAFAAATA
jgi:uncharacterized membrane protein YgdD (TMEM256/DUF423 family)